MFKRIAQPLGWVLACWSPTLWALSLGEIEVQSHLNQPLQATIALPSATAAELESLQIRVAPEAAFERAGIERADYISSLSFEVGKDGSPRIKVSSAEIARAPFLSFLIEARWVGGRLMREYTVLLDPPNLATAGGSVSTSPAPSAPVSAPRPVAQPQSPSFYGDQDRGAASAPAPAQPQPRPAAAAAVEIPEYRSSASYGPIAKQETLWSIAYKLRPDPSISMDQMQIALFEANPDAFIGNISQLRRGVTLRVPAVDEVLAVDPATAKQRVAAARRSNAVATTKPAPRPAPKPAAKPAAKPLPAEPEPTQADAGEAVTPSSSEAEEEYADDELDYGQPDSATDDVQATQSSQPPASSAKNNGSALSQLQALAGKKGSASTPAQASTPATATEPAEEDGGAELAEEEFVDESLDGEADGAVAELEETVDEELADAETASPPTPVAQVVSTPASNEESGGWLGWMLGILLLIGGGAGGWWYFRKRRGQPQAVSSHTPAKPAPQAPATDEDEDDVAAAAAATVASASVASTAKADAFDQTAITEAAGSDTEALQSLERDASDLDDEDQATQQQATMEQTVADDVAAEVSGDDVDFDVTAQFAAETMQINLDANDPISEADFHLAYGLYDEASMMLKAAQEKEPERTDIKIKLAETYFAGGNSAEFLETARGLKSELDDADWQKIAIMGSQIAPDDALFQGASADLGAADMDLDFGGDEDADADAATELSLDAEPEAEPVSEAADAEPAQDPVLEFDLDSALSEAQGEDKQDQSAADEEAKGNELEFDLGDFDLGESETDAPAADGKAAEPEANDVAEAEAEPTKAAAEDLSLDQDFGLGEPEADAAEEDANAGGEFDLADLELDDEIGESDSISDGDEASTQLDLARAYVDMGDSEMARGLLDEVVKSGNDEQKQQAEELIKRLPS